MANRYADGTLSGYADETEEERSDRMHREAENHASVRRSMIKAGWVIEKSPEEIANHRAQWRSL